jgi:hypothetical protein
MNALNLVSAVAREKTMVLSSRLFIFRRLAVAAFALAWLVIVGDFSRAYCMVMGQAAVNDPTDCRRSNQMRDNDQTLMRLREAPTHFRLMTGRYVAMVQAARGYQCTGTVTVGFDGYHYFQTGRGDDPGILELVPTLSRLTGLSLAATYDISIIFSIAGGLFVGYAGFWRLYPERRLRWIGAGIFLCLGVAEARVADEYMFQISPLIAGIPWLLYFALARRPHALTVSAATLAFLCSWCSLVRAGTIPICMTFLVAMFFIRRHIQRPLVPCLLLILACIPSVIFEQSLIARRDAALAKVGETATTPDSHVLWHTLYIGLGFIPNSEVPEYRDAVAGDKARSIDPAAIYASARYETIIKQEVWSLVKRKPMLVMGILAVKASIVMFLALILLYPARRLMFTESALVWFDSALVLTMGMSAMNAIVAVPRASYLLAFLCLGFLYSAIKLCRAQYQSSLSRLAAI